MADLNADFAKKVFDKLSLVDISKHVKKKNNLDYLSWSYCWSYLMTEYPLSSYKFQEPIFFGDGSCEIWVELTISDGANLLSRSMYLAVTDYKSTAIKSPNSVDICNSRMRCLVKCAAMFGLGMSLYAGEDLPKSKPTLSKNSDNWDVACEHIMKRSVTVAQTCNKYDVSGDDKKALEKIYEFGRLPQEAADQLTAVSNDEITELSKAA